MGRSAGVALLAFVGVAGAAVDGGAAARWIEDVLRIDAPSTSPRTDPGLRLLRQDYEELERGRSVVRTPLVIGRQSFARGLGTHSVSLIEVCSPDPIVRFEAWIGVDNNVRTQGGKGSVAFAVCAGDVTLYRSGILCGGEEAVRVVVDVAGARVLELRVGDGGDGPACDHADWAEATVTLESGKTVALDELALAVSDNLLS